MNDNIERIKVRERIPLSQKLLNGKSLRLIYNRVEHYFVT